MVRLRITGFLDFVPRAVLDKLENTFRKLDLFPSSGENRETPTVLGPYRIGVSLLSPEDGNKPIFRNVMFSRYLEYIGR
jgi:hypothetical protein